MKLGRLLACSIAAFFPQAGKAAWEPVGRSDHWIDYPVHPIGWGWPEISVAGLLVPWIVTIAAVGFLAAWLLRQSWSGPALLATFGTCPCVFSR
jgi:hypothetical protein